MHLDPSLTDSNCEVQRKISGLPNLESIEPSEIAFSKAFLETAYVLCQSFEQLKVLLLSEENFTNELLYKIAMGLFGKLQRHYYSFVLLETENDFLGSQFLLEQIYRSATTLVYLLEETDEVLLSAYVNQAHDQADYLLKKVERQRQFFPEHSGLSALQERLEAIRTQKNTSISVPLPEHSITVKGLDFLEDPARLISLDVMPATWLDVQLNYLEPKSMHAGSNTNFTLLRDVGHLCLHAAQCLSEEVVRKAPLKTKAKSLTEHFSEIFTWLHEAHNAYYRAHLLPDNE
jgi:hypothetical protein